MLLLLSSLLATQRAPIGVGSNLIPNISGRILTDPFSLFEEVLSNSLDAIYRRRNMRTDIDALYQQFDVEIEVKDGSIIFRDHGIGITEDDLRNKICKIGNSNDQNVIGKFGWGFFSIFAVAESCSIKSRCEGDKVLKAFLKLTGSDDEAFEYHFVDDVEFERGTELVVNLKPGFNITEDEVYRKISHMFIEDFRFQSTDLKLNKSEQTIDKEFEKLQSDLADEIQSQKAKRSEIEEKIQKKNDRAKEIPTEIDDLTIANVELENEKNHAKKSGEQDEADVQKNVEELDPTIANEKGHAKKSGEQDETEVQKKVEELDPTIANEKGHAKKSGEQDEAEVQKKVEELEATIKGNFEKIETLRTELSTVESDIAQLEEDLESAMKDLAEKERKSINRDDIPRFKTIPLHPWTDSQSQDELIEFAHNKLQKSSIKLATQFKFNLKSKGKESNFNALVLVPEYDNNPTQQQDFNGGSLNIYVTGCKIPSPTDIETKGLLKGCHIIIKSNDAELNSLRENFEDKNLSKLLIDELKSRILKLFADQDDDLVHNYERILKSDFLDHKRCSDPNHKVLERFKKVLSFISDTNKPITLHKLTKNLDSISKQTPDDESPADADISQYKRGDAIYYTTIPSSLSKLPNPVLDGVNAPYIFINTLLDEQIIQDLKEFQNYKLTNLSHKTFINNSIENADDHKPILEFIKTTLKPFISNCLLSQQLIDCPMKIVEDEHALSSLVRSAIGTNDIEKNPMRMFFDKKPILHINPSHPDIKAIKDFEDKQKKSVIELLFHATAIGSCINPYSRVQSYATLSNLAKEFTKTEKLRVEEEKSPFDIFGGDNFMDILTNANKFDNNQKSEEDPEIHENKGQVTEQNTYAETDTVNDQQDSTRENQDAEDETFKETLQENTKAQAVTEGIREEL